jgi:4-amino-4-deoxy-L-arabinose transferase-like glycosyltransferase
MGPAVLRVVLGVVVLSTLLSPWRRELYVGDETKYGQVVHEMRSGSLVVPMLGGQPFTHKPPLHFWAMALLSFPLGLYSIWPFVLPSLIAFVALIWVMKRMGDELFGPEAGGWAAFVSATSLMIWGSAQTARMDVEFTLLVTAGIWMLRRFLRSGESRDLLVAAGLIAAATLDKGPMAPVIAVALILIERLQGRRAPRGPYLAALGIIAGTMLLWLIPAVMAGGENFMREVVMKQTVGRAVGSWVHRSPPWFYLVRAPLTFFPWLLLLVIALVVLYRGKVAGSQWSVVGGVTGRSAAPENHPQQEGQSHRSPATGYRLPATFCVSWLLAVVVPYSLISSKLDIYMMAAIPPAALLIGWLLSEAPDSRVASWVWRANASMLLILAAIGAAGLILTPKLLRGLGPDEPLVSAQLVRILFAILIGSSAGWLVVCSVRVRDRTMLSTLAVGITVVIALGYAASVMIGPANEIASTNALIRVLQQQGVEPEATALYSCPYLWRRDFPRELERVRYVGLDIRSGSAQWPALVATSRAHAREIAGPLRGYRKVAELRMIGKWFDVYRRR